MVTNQSASLSINVIKIDIDHVPLAFLICMRGVQETLFSCVRCLCVQTWKHVSATILKYAKVFPQQYFLIFS